MPINAAPKGARRNTTIEWCTHTRNFAAGCSEARRDDGTMVPACVHCYARFTSLRVQRMQESQGRTSVHEGVSRAVGGRSAVWTGLFRWDRELMARHFAAMRPGDLTFINSMSDLWHPDHDPAMLTYLAVEISELRRRWRYHAAGVPRVVALTKRAAGLLAWQRRLFPDGLPAHVIAGVTGGEQPDVDDQLRHLLQVNMRGPRVLSIEPITGPVNIRGAVGGLCRCEGCMAARVGWVIVGAESGPGARPIDLQWVRDLRDQVAGAGVPFFYKQGPGEDGRLASTPELDGKVWAEIPAIRREP